jgi:autotransporter-associated beta strand protein
MHRGLLTTTATAALLAASPAQASRIFQEQPCPRTNGSRPFGLPLPKRPRLRATASAALNLAARIAIPVIVLNGISGVASAQDATWNGPGADWNTSTNWISATPGPNGTATFAGALPTTVSMAGAVTVGTLQFNAPNYIFNVDAASVNINGQGIIGLANAATFNIVSTVGATPALDFNGTSSAGTAHFILGQVVDTAGGFNAGFINFRGRSTAGQATITTRDASATNFFDSSNAGHATLIVENGGFVGFNDQSSGAQATVINNAGGEVGLFGLSTAGNATITSSGLISFRDQGSAGNATINTHFGQTNFFDTSTAGNAAFTVIEGNMDFFNNSSAGTATINAGRPVSQNGGFDAGFIKFHDTSTADHATIFSLDGSSVEFHDSSTAAQARLIVNNGGFVGFADQSTGAQATVINNAGGEVKIADLATGGTSFGSIEGAGTYTLGSKQLTVGSLGTSTTVSGVIQDHFPGESANVGGSLIKVGTGTLTLTGNNTYTGGTTINAGTLAVNGSIASSSLTTVNSGAVLSGSGFVGNTIVNGTIAPGNGPNIGTLNVNGTYTQNAGSTYQVKVGSQSDLINITGNANINGGTVAVQAVAGVTPKTYRIVTATGGVAGTYSGLTLTDNSNSNFAFVTPLLIYDPNNVFLTMRTSFANAAGETRNEINVGRSLDVISAAVSSGAVSSGASKDDIVKVLTVLANLNLQQGLPALDAISGQPWADFGTMNTNNGMMFMNALGQQMANARGAVSAGQRQALAQACEIADCDGTGPLSAWASALGGLGSVLGDGNASTLTYNFAGAAAGLDYRIDPRFLVGIGVGYTHGWEWVNSFPGQGYTDSASVAVYGSFTQSGFYVDALAGYAYYNNQVHRQIMIPGLDQRIATGSTGANQFLGQIEGGYKVDVYAPAAATITPFGRFQITSVTQNGFTESGAQSIGLNVFQQTTNSQRTTVGVDLAGAIGIGDDRKLNLDFRLGWMHEFGDTNRPLTAAFAGGLGNAFTVFAASPARNSAVLGLSAMANIAAATQLYLRYDGEIATGTDNHAINLGVRFSW